MSKSSSSAKKGLLNVLVYLEVVCASNRDAEIRTASARLCRALTTTSLPQDPKNVQTFTQIFGYQWNNWNFGCDKKKGKKHIGVTVEEPHSGSIWQAQKSNSCPICQEFHSDERMAYTALKNSSCTVTSKGYNRKCFPCSRKTVHDRSIQQCTEYAGDLARQFVAHFTNLFLDLSFCNNIPP